MDEWTSIITSTDSYKLSHFKQYPEGTSIVMSYVESRGIASNQLMIPQDAETVFLGIQAFIHKYLLEPITITQINWARKFAEAHGEPFNFDGWMYIFNKHDGLLPLEIEAVPEGTVMKPSNVMVQVHNTDPECYWLTSYVETALLRSIWYPTTVATVSRECKKIIKKYLDMTSDDPEGQIAFKLHDFGARGVSSQESAMIGGAAHLVNFMGTDTFEALFHIGEVYGDVDVGFSIPASEHSTMTLKGRDGEAEQMERMLDQFPDSPIVACVSDSYDIYNAVAKIWGDKLKEKILSRDGTLVIRPDSGDPVKTPVWIVERLSKIFGYTVNNKGYKVLDPHVRVIQGDGVNPSSINQILDQLEIRGFSADNIAFGMGGALLQKVDRDTLKFAMKANAAMIDGKWVDVFKQPIDEPFKKSKSGVLALVKEDGEYKTVRGDEVHAQKDELVRMYKNGRFYNQSTFAEVRERAAL